MYFYNNTITNWKKVQAPILPMQNKFLTTNVVLRQMKTYTKVMENGTFVSLFLYQNPEKA